MRISDWSSDVCSSDLTVIVGFDEDFHEKLPYLFPHTDAKSWFDGPRDGRSEAAFRNGSLQGAYLILAARARPRHRTDVGLRQREGRRGLLQGHDHQVQLPRQPRPGRPEIGRANV